MRPSLVKFRANIIFGGFSRGVLIMMKIQPTAKFKLSVTQMVTDIASPCALSQFKSNKLLQNKSLACEVPKQKNKQSLRCSCSYTIVLTEAVIRS